MLGSHNPVLTAEAFDPRHAWGNLERDAARSELMTIPGTAMITGLLLLVVAAAAIGLWVLAPSIGVVMWAGIGGTLLSFILTLTIYFKQTWSPVLALPIAIGEGAFVGFASVIWSRYAEGNRAAGATGVLASLSPGLLIQAGLLTFCIAGVVLVLNATGVVRATGRFMSVLMVATTGICLASLLSWVGWMAGFNIPFLWDNGPIGIAFAGIIVVVAAMTLVVDFEFIREGAEQGLPKHMQWYAAIGLMVTLVWLYVSILRLLAKLRR